MLDDYNWLLKNLKKTMSEEFKVREKEIAKKAIVVYNKKKENIYKSVVKDILKIAELLSPFIPESAEKIKKQFSAKKIRKSEILFKKI